MTAAGAVPPLGHDHASVLVVGGGIAGLAAAHALRRELGPSAALTIVDGARALGGKLRTSEIEGVAVDEGAEMFLAGVPEAVDLARAVGLGDELAHPVTTAASVAVGGGLHPLPTGTVLGVPADLAALAASGILTRAALAQVLAEADSPGEAVLGDISVGGLIRRRLGEQVHDRLVDPLVGGVYAGQADGLSLQATMPALSAALRTPRSLVAAAVAARGVPTGAPAFATVRRGLGGLVDAVLAGLDAGIQVGLPVREISRTRTGFRLVCGPVPHPTVLYADAVVVAVPAAPAARLLRDVAPAAAADLAGIGYASTAIVTLAYAEASLPAGSGLLVASAEGRAVKAVTYSSQKWAHLSGGLTILRASIGRYGDAAVLQRSDEDLAALAASDVAALTGIAGRLVASRVTRWGGALPQYAVGHLDRVARIEADVARIPGLAVAGAAYRGVGVPACIRSGYAAAARVAGHLRQSAHG